MRAFSQYLPPAIALAAGLLAADLLGGGAAPPPESAPDAIAPDAITPATAPAPAPLVSLEEGSWLLYRGSLRIVRRSGDESETSQADLEIVYLALGGPPPGPVLLLRNGESGEDEKLAFTEAVSLERGEGLSLRPAIQLEERQTRVSPIAFTYLPLGIFPSTGDASPREWRGPAKLALLSPVERELPALHRVEPAAGPGIPPGAVRYSVRLEKPERLALSIDRSGAPFEILEARDEFIVQPPSPAPGPSSGSAAGASRGRGKLLGFRSLRRGRFLGEAGPVSEVATEIDLSLAEETRLEGERWAALRAEARALAEIERTLFAALDADGAEGKAAAFARDFPRSRLGRYAAGLARQAEVVAPIARERRLIGKPAPDFTLRDLAGKEITFSRLLPGKITLLAFGSVACTACRVEAPFLSRFDEKFRARGFQAIAVDADDGDTLEKVAALREKLKLTHTIFLQGEKASDRYEVEQVFPTSFWIDHRGVIVRRETGFEPAHAKEIERRIEELLRRRDEEAAAPKPGGAPGEKQP